MIKHVSTLQLQFWTIKYKLLLSMCLVSLSCQTPDYQKLQIILFPLDTLETTDDKVLFGKMMNYTYTVISQNKREGLSRGLLNMAEFLDITWMLLRFMLGTKKLFAFLARNAFSQQTNRLSAIHAVIYLQNFLLFGKMKMIMAKIFYKKGEYYEVNNN